MRITGKKTYRKQIFAGMLISAVIPLALFYSLLIMAVGAYSNKNLQKEAGELIDLVAENLEVGFKGTAEGLRALSENTAIHAVLRENDGSETPAVYRQMYVVDKEYGKIANFCIYDKDGNLISYVGSDKFIESGLATDWGVLFEANMYPGEYIIRNGKKYQGTEKKKFLRIGRAITDEDVTLGYAVAVIDSDNIDYMLEGTGIEKAGVIHILDDFDEPVYASVSVAAEEEFEAVEKELLRSLKNSIVSDDEEYIYYHGYDETIKLHIIFRQYVKFKKELMGQLTVFGAMGAALCIVLSFILSGFFSRKFYNPIQKITTDIEKVGQGDYTARIDIDKSNEDELSVLSRNINKMTEALEENTGRLIERERELGNANIKMMQAQLNPHFIYNTLDTIKWIGKANDVPEVATISSRLAKILRTSINSEQFVTLNKELELVESYMEIQKIRFDDKFEFIIDISNEYMKVCIPKLILQPAVENSIVHGFEERDNGKILITAENEGSTFIIKISDDGCGIGEDELKRLNRFEEPNQPEKEEKSGNSIGLYNVNAIIKLHYGDEYGIHIASEYNRGTTVTYRLPL